MVDRRTRPTDLGQLQTLNEREIADREAENGLLQFDQMLRLIDQAIASGQPPLTPAVILEFQRLAVEGLEPVAGQFRTSSISIDGTNHIPPPWAEVGDLVDEMCEYVSLHWDETAAIHLSAYVMWRLNWIHPFTNGNGRTSRVASYLVLCAALGMNLPGDHAVPEIIDEDKQDYYDALDQADAKWLDQVLDVTAMERVIEAALTVQLAAASESVP